MIEQWIILDIIGIINERHVLFFVSLSFLTSGQRYKEGHSHRGEGKAGGRMQGARGRGFREEDTERKAM